MKDKNKLVSGSDFEEETADPRDRRIGYFTMYNASVPPSANCRRS